MRVARPELEALDLDDLKGARVLAILGKTDRTFTLNLKAPLIINLERNLGRQVVTNGDLPVQFKLGDRRSTYKLTA
jgi:flagellar assembly factor FliW